MADLLRLVRDVGYFFMRGCLTLIVGVLVLLAVVTIAGAPPNHEILSAGSRAVAYQVAYGTYVPGPIAPTTSLTNARCQAWLDSHSNPCPDAATLAAKYWPSLQPAPDTLYVGFQPNCGWESPVFYVELYPESSVTIHCHWTKPLIDFERPPMGVTAQPGFTLLVLSTSTWTPGQYWVYQQDLVERWGSANSQTWFLGMVQVTNSD